MTTLVNPVTTTDATPESGPGCGCCIPPRDASIPEGRQRALADLQARREALERRLEGLEAV